MLSIAKIDRYDMVNTPGDSKPCVTVWFSGCSIKCEECYNKRLWDGGGVEYEVRAALFAVEHTLQTNGLDSVAMLGGEPLDQDAYSFISLVRELKKHGYEIWLYTGYELYDIAGDVLDNIYTLKTGRYDETLKQSGILASSNQHFWRKNESGEWTQIEL